MSEIEEKLTSYIERIESLEEEKANVAQDIKDLYAEAKVEGFDPKILRQVIRYRKMEPQEIEEQQSLLTMYMQALGMYHAIPHQPAEAAAEADPNTL